nr:hypothetical protein [Solanum melongena]WMB96956.1 hypothetical protein [Solanum melongena]WMB97168.1 hypothetical protein [Solanum aethiopicum]
MHFIKQLFTGVERCAKVSWRGLLEQTRQLKGLLFRVPLAATVSMSKEIALAGCDFVFKVRTMKRRSGLLFTALYLKQCAVCLQRYYADSYKASDQLSVPISLTRCGIPRIIPSVLRKHIRTKSDHGDMLVKMYLSWFGLAKLIAVAAKVTKATFKSITSPHPDIGSVLEVLEEMKTSFRDLQPIYLPRLHTFPLELGMHWEPTWKSTPLLDAFVRQHGLTVDDKVDKASAKYAKDCNIFVNLKHELAAFIWNIKKIHSFPDGFFSPGMLWCPQVFYPLDY